MMLLIDKTTKVYKRLHDLLRTIHLVSGLTQRPTLTLSFPFSLLPTGGLTPAVKDKIVPLIRLVFFPNLVWPDSQQCFPSIEIHW